jgi:hypothetical protein
MHIKIKYLLLLGLLLPFISCKRFPVHQEASSEKPELYPDYTGITIPPNIAPMNFRILNPGDRFLVYVSSSEGRPLKIRSENGKIIFPAGSWKKLLSRNRGRDIEITIFSKTRKEGWRKLPPVTNHVAEEEIDAYIAFRRIPEAFILWKDMGIYQRSLENFREYPIMVNSIVDENCMNCHSFNAGNPKQMLFHMRGPFGGTVLSDGEELRFIDTKSENTRAAGVYPAWHPGGELIAFSVNQINQGFHSKIGKSDYVLDKHSDIIFYDLKDNSVTRPAELATDRLENMPAWSANGHTLYFICAPPMEKIPSYDKTIYSLLSIDYDLQTKKFGAIDTLLDGNQAGMSISFPRERPGRNQLSFIGLDYGYFSIYNPEAEVYIMDLDNREFHKAGINSKFTESYPSWSKNGSWLLFVSKRGDGLLSQPWFCYVDEDGVCSREFVLPQKDPDFYKEYRYNYNRPEFITGRVLLNPRKVLSLARKGASPTIFDQEHSVSAVSGATLPSADQQGKPGSMYEHD